MLVGGPTLRLLHTYLFFGIPIVSPTLELPENYSLEMARDTLLDPATHDLPLMLKLESVIQLPEGSDDALTFKGLFLHYDALMCGEDCVKLTAKEWKLLTYEDIRDVALIPEPGSPRALTPSFPLIDDLISDNPAPVPSASTSATPPNLSSTSASSEPLRASGWDNVVAVSDRVYSTAMALLVKHRSTTTWRLIHW